MKQHLSTIQLPWIQVIRLKADRKDLATMLIGTAMFGNSVNQVYAEK